MSAAWWRVIIALGVIVGAFVLAKLVDTWIAHRDLAPGVATRYRVLRRTIFAIIVFIGVMSALLLIPQVRAFAGAILASSAVLGLIIGLAAQRTLGNFIAGILIAFTQPVRLGDEVEVQGTRGVVEEIGLTYTWVHTRDNDQLVIPNETLASETIRNSTIRTPDTLAEITVEVPLTADLEAVLEALEPGTADVSVTSLDKDAVTVSLRSWVLGNQPADRAESDLRIQAHKRLQKLGLYD